MSPDRVVIVTGGATGIGKGIAGVLASQGARIAIVQPEPEQAGAAAREIPGAAPFAADIGDSEEVRQVVQDVAERFGRIDALVNNAAITGLAAVNGFLDIPEQQTNRLIDVNLKGTIWMSQTVARWMVMAGQPGNIVHIASVGAFAAQELASVYCATKAAQISLTRSMALELAPHNIRVNAIAPGDILTESNADMLGQIRALGAAGHHWRNTPMGRRGTPAEIGEAVAFLISEKASFITGAVLTVDGGLLTY